jgi:cytochrome c-type protein NapC
MTDADNNAPADAPERRGLIGRTWAWLRRPSGTIALGTLLAVGFISGVLAWGGFNWGMELTNTETFCITCHEMKDNVYAEYKTTIHYSNRSGVRATCPDCHVPKDWTHKIARKIQASNELYHHFMNTVSTPEKFEAKRIELARNEWARMKKTDSQECRNCHNLVYMDFTRQEPRSAKRHQEALDQGKTCIECHKGIAHRLPRGAYEAASELDGNPHAEAGKAVEFAKTLGGKR